FGAAERQVRRREGAEAVGDDDRSWPVLANEPGIVEDGADLGCKVFDAVARPPPALAHAGEIERRDRVVVHEGRGDVVPPVRMGRAAVDEEDTATRPGLAARPGPVMYR